MILPDDHRSNLFARYSDRILNENFSTPAELRSLWQEFCNLFDDLFILGVLGMDDVVNLELHYRRKWSEFTLRDEQQDHVVFGRIF